MYTASPILASKKKNKTFIHEKLIPNTQSALNLPIFLY